MYLSQIVFYEYPLQLMIWCFLHNVPTLPLMFYCVHLPPGDLVTTRRESMMLLPSSSLSPPSLVPSPSSVLSAAYLHLLLHQLLLLLSVSPHFTEHQSWQHIRVSL